MGVGPADSRFVGRRAPWFIFLRENNYFFSCLPNYSRPARYFGTEKDDFFSALLIIVSGGQTPLTFSQRIKTRLKLLFIRTKTISGGRTPTNSKLAGSGPTNYFGTDKEAFFCPVLLLIRS